MAIPQSYGPEEISDALRELYDSIVSREDVQAMVDAAIASIEAETVTVGDEVFVDRGDPSSADFTESDLTIDGSWYELDLSTIIPEAATLVLLRGFILDTTSDDEVRFREPGNLNDFNCAVLRTGGGANMAQDLWVVPSNQKIEYNAISGASPDIDITIGGWRE